MRLNELCWQGFPAGLLASFFFLLYFIILGYELRSQTFKIYNKKVRRMKVMFSRAKDIAVLSLVLFSFIAFPTPRIGKHDTKDHQVQVEESLANDEVGKKYYDEIAFI
jgi:hypothetical protein